MNRDRREHYRILSGAGCGNSPTAISAIVVRPQMIAMRNCTAVGQSPLRDMMPAYGVCNRSTSTFRIRLQKCPQRRYIVGLMWIEQLFHAKISTAETEAEMMVTKRVTPVTKTRRKAVAAAPELNDSAAIAVLESVQTATTKSTTAHSNGIDADIRRQLVAAEAYFLAERRGFAAGSELDDWIAAEAAVDSRLQRMRVA
jgi:hypothetical protein